MIGRGGFSVKHFFSSIKFHKTVALLAAIGILISSFSGCSSADAKKGMEALSNTYNSLASQIASSLNSSLSSEKKNSLAASAKKITVSSRTAGIISKIADSAVPSGKADVQTVKKLIGALPAASTPKKNIVNSMASAAKYSAVTQRSDYLHLSSLTEKSLYSLIGRSVQQVALQTNSSGYYPIGQVSIAGEVSEAQIRIALMAYMDDNPQVFWLAGVYSYGYRGNGTILQLYSVYSPDQCNAAIQRLDSAVSSVIKSMPSGLSQFSREEYLFNYIVNHCTYDDAAVSDSSRWQAFTSYGALVDGTAVCEGYSRAMQLLAGYAGISCTLIRGSSGGAGHMWNAIQINGAWYHLDVTWCDNSILIYNYYNVSDSVIRQTHSIGQLATSLSDNQINSALTQFNIYLPVCSAMAENYFRVKGIPVSTLNGSGDSTVIHALASKMKNEQKSIAFSISGEYNAMISGMMTSSPYKMSTWLNAAGKLAGKSVNPGKTIYVTDKTDSGLTIQVEYR